MKKSTFFALLVLALARPGAAQVSGGAGVYGRDGGDEISPLQIERAKRQLTVAETKDDGTATFVDAAVLMNARADEYVAVWALFALGETPDASSATMNSTLAQFSASLDALGVAAADSNVDYISQSRIYSFDISNAKTDDNDNRATATEKLSGFELKKNVAVRFRNLAQLDALNAAAASAGIFDLVKVDYIVKDTAAIRERLQGQTMNIIRQKAARYSTELGVKLGQPVQIVADIPSVYFPIDQYESYVAAESENLNVPYDRSRDTVLKARKSASAYFEPLTGDGFDAVINPIITEPVVQFTTYIKVKFAPPKKK